MLSELWKSNTSNGNYDDDDNLEILIYSRDERTLLH